MKKKLSNRQHSDRSRQTKNDVQAGTQGILRRNTLERSRSRLTGDVIDIETLDISQQIGLGLSTTDLAPVFLCTPVSGK